LQLGTPGGGDGLDLARKRARLLDSRPWFTPVLDKEEEVTRC
jgi:hypothetical protein